MGSREYVGVHKVCCSSEGSLAATMSIFSMVGGCSKSSGAFSMRAATTLPDRCADLPSSSGNTSKIPKVDGSRRIPNQATVSGSIPSKSHP